MAQMTWTGAGEPAPGAGTVAGFGFFNVVLNYIFNQFNAVDTIVSAATTVGAANQLVKTTAAGGIVATGNVAGTAGIFSGAVTGRNAVLSAVAPTDAPLLVRGAASQSQVLQAWQDSTATSKAFITAGGDGSFASLAAAFANLVATSAATTPLLVTGAPAQSALLANLRASDLTTKFSVDPTGVGTFAGAVTAPAFHGVADSTLSVAPGLGTGAGTLTLTFAAYNFWNNTGQWVNYPGGTYVYGAGGNLAVPGGGVYRYDLFYLDTSGTLTAVAGANGTDLATAYTNRPALVVNAHPLNYVVLRPSTTAIYSSDQGTAGTGYLRDARDPFSAPYSTSAGGVGGVTAIAQNAGTVQVNGDGSVSLSPAAGKATNTSRDVQLTGTAKLTMAQGVYTPATNPSYMVTTLNSNLTSSGNFGGATGVGNRTATWAFVDNAPDTGGTNDNAVIRVDQTLLTNTSGNQIAKTGILVNIYTPTDNGGDTSGLSVIQTGGGNGVSSFHSTALRPAGSIDLWNSPQVAFEGATDGGSSVFFAEPGYFYTGYTGAMTQTTFTVAALVSDTTITVVSTAAFPASGWLRLYNAAMTAYEDVAYSGKTGTTFTGLTRSLAGDTARAFAIADLVFMIHPAQGYIARIENAASEGFLAYALNGQSDAYRLAYGVGTKNFGFTSTDLKFGVRMNGSAFVSSAGNGATDTPTTAVSQGATFSIFERTIGVGSGGVLQLGTGSDLTGYKPFATIKGSLQDGTNNGLGDIVFGTRTANTDTTTTERVRIRNGAVGPGLQVGTNADAAHLNFVATRTAASAFTAIASGAQQSQTLTGFTGLTVGDVALVSFSTSLPAGCVAYANVATTTTVVVTVYNISGGSVTPSGTIRAVVHHYV